MIGRLACFFGFHRWGPWMAHSDAPRSRVHARSCQRRTCTTVQWDDVRYMPPIGHPDHGRRGD